MYTIFLIIALVFNAFANILMKLANVRCNLPSDASTTEKLMGLYFSWPFITGLAAFGLNLLFYTQALKKWELSIAYPVMTGSGFALIGISSYFLFSEKLSPIQITGIVFILVGIILITQQSASI